TCLSAFYDLSVVARPGDLGIAGILSSPSINDSGDIAFTGHVESGALFGEGIFVGNPLRNITPNFAMPTFTFQDSVQISDQISGHAKVVAADRRAGTPPIFRLQTWDASSVAGSPTILVSAGRFTSIEGYPSISSQAALSDKS